MKHILLMRHSKSDWSHGEADFERPLNERGKVEAVLMGKWLNMKAIKPEYIVASPAKRAKKTIKRVIEVVGFNEDNIHWDDKFYYGDEFDYIRCLQNLPDSINSAMLVGHNPSIEMAVKKLVSSEQIIKEIKTSTIASITADISNWSELMFNKNVLNFIIYPSEAKLSFEGIA